jgi:hypothetical protein
MKYIQIIGVGIGLIAFIGFASAPINKQLNPIQNKIEIESRTEINFMPQPIKEPIKISKYPIIRDFLDNLPNCKWCIICGSYARYTRLEAEKQGIGIHEITLTIPQPKGTSALNYFSEHRINYFYAEDGHQVYIDNMFNKGIILESFELKDYVKDNFNITVERFGFKK